MKHAIVALLFLIVASQARAQAWPSVAGDLPRIGGGEEDVAVVVGISDYFALQDVPGAADNARDWFQYLVRVRGVPSARASLLVDADATRGKIERALKAAASGARPNGRAIVVFVGHGAPAPSGDDGLLLAFKTGHNSLKKESDEALTGLAEFLIAVGRDARVECHSDAQGDDDFNERLTQARAESVVDWLAAHGVSRNKLRAIGYGERMPIATNETAAGRADNRRCAVLWDG